MRVHYPRTAHLPWSPGATPDDVRTGDLRGLSGREVVVTEKLDGENTTLYRDGLHARSLDSAHHPSRAWVKALHGRIASRIPDGWRVCGENMFARHSLAYEDLDSGFYGFSVWDETDRCLDWDETVRFLHGLGIPTPPVLWRGVFDEKTIRALRLDLGTQEGYVVRAAAGFAREEFGARVAKWVRPNHVQTDTHWMQADVVPNRLGPRSIFWSLRSGAHVDTSALLAAIGFDEAHDPVIDETLGRIDVAHRFGDVRLIAAVAAALHSVDRTSIATRLAAGPLGMPLARRIADLVGLHGRLHTPFPDEQRRNGLARMSLAADLGALHALSEAVLAHRADDEAKAAREQVQWSALHAEDSGLMVPEPWRPLREGLRAELADVVPRPAADRCWAQARHAWAEGRLASVEEALAATWKWRGGEFPQLIQLIGPSGSGKSRFAAGLGDVAAVVSMDDIREERGSRADQKSNAEVLTAALGKLESALSTAGPGARVLWDATGLNRPQRNLVLRAAHAADTYVTQAVFLAEAETLRARNAVRPHPVPDQVLTGQLHRFQPPYPGEAHRLWYLDGSGAVADADGEL
ncbi:MAG TPA: RNA ligase family protein [Actinospica sp.]|jgi:predicted kinase|nr:RNA ligase family protein [Actinospica sp.]